MSTGTLSEKRKLVEEQVPTTPLNPVVVEAPVPTTTPTPLIKVTNTPLETPGVTEPRQSRPVVTNHVKDSCSYCKADVIAALSFRFGLVVLLLALSFKLVKTSK